MSLGDALRIRADEEHQQESYGHEAGRCDPRQGEGVAVEVPPAEERAEDGRPENGAEDRPEEDERNPPRAAGGRVHVTGGSASEQRDAAGRPHAEEPRHDRRWGIRRRAQRCEQSPGDAERETDGENGNTAKAVHGPPGGKGGERSRGEHERGAEAEQPFDIDDERKGDRRDRRRELQRGRVGRERGGQERGVAPDRELRRLVQLPRPYSRSPARNAAAPRGVSAAVALLLLPWFARYR
ncbi:MAG: hypothetical protein WD027_04990 [Gaiellales bacterium]